MRTSSKHITLTRNLKDVIDKYKENVLNINFWSLSCHDGSDNPINFDWEVSSCSIDKSLDIIHDLQFTNWPSGKFVTCYFINFNFEFFKCFSRISWNSNCTTDSNSQCLIISITISSILDCEINYTRTLSNHYVNFCTGSKTSRSGTVNQWNITVTQWFINNNQRWISWCISSSWICNSNTYDVSTTNRCSSNVQFVGACQRCGGNSNINCGLNSCSVPRTTVSNANWLNCSGNRNNGSSTSGNKRLISKSFAWSNGYNDSTNRNGRSSYICSGRNCRSYEWNWRDSCILWECILVKLIFRSNNSCESTRSLEDVTYKDDSIFSCDTSDVWSVCFEGKLFLYPIKLRGQIIKYIVFMICVISIIWNTAS